MDTKYKPFTPKVLNHGGSGRYFDPDFSDKDIELEFSSAKNSYVPKGTPVTELSVYVSSYESLSRSVSAGKNGDLAVSLNRGAASRFYSQEAKSLERAVRAYSNALASCVKTSSIVDVLA